MLASLLTNIPTKLPQVESGANAKLQNDNSASDDFGRVLRQQGNQQIRDNKNSKESVSDSSKECKDDCSNFAPPSSEPAESEDKEIKYEQDVKNSVDENESAKNIKSDKNSLMDVTPELDASSSWSFWVQYVQGSAPNIVQDLDCQMQENSNIPILTSEMQNVLTDQTAAPVVEANTININAQLPQQEINVLSKAKINLAPLNSVASEVPFVVKDSSAIEMLDVPPNTVGQENTGFPQLVAASLPVTTFKGAVDAMSQHSQALPLFNSIATDLPAADAAQNLNNAQDSKWVSQAENVSYPTGMSSIENKSFFQLRFNQQTLAPDLVEKTGWLIEHKLDTAQIQLDPPELGPITVKIHTHQEQVSVTFVVNNLQVRDAMDQTMQRLKDLLQEQGIVLSHADVNGQRQQREHQPEGAPTEASLSESNDDEMLTIAVPEITQGVDHFV